MQFLVKLANNSYWNQQKLVQSTWKAIWQYNSVPTKYSYSDLAQPPLRIINPEEIIRKQNMVCGKMSPEALFIIAKIPKNQQRKERNYTITITNYNYKYYGTIEKSC